MSHRENNTIKAAVSRRNFIRLSAAGAASMLLFGVAGCAPKTGASKSPSYAPGVYTGVSDGKGGPLTAQVTFDETAIVSIEVSDHLETPFLSDVAIAGIPADIIAYQSLGIDTVTGATLSSMAVLAAVEDCVKQAGGSASDLKKVPAKQKVSETVELDAEVVVVGAGASGMAAAIAAAQNGAKKVVLLEKTSNMGGNALVSGGWIHYIYAPDELRATMDDGYRAYFESVINRGLQEGPALGIDASFIDEVKKEYDDYYAAGATTVFDSENYFALEYQFANGGTFDKWKKYSKILPPLNEWLTNLGLPWDKLHSIVGYPWPRWTGPTGGGHGGEGYYDLFSESLQSDNLPITMITLTSAKELLVENGKVIGVVGECEDGTTYRISADKGVILATGGYSGNPEMLKKYNTYWEWDDKTVIPTTNAFGHTGDGIAMAVEVGASTAYMENPMMLPLADKKDYSTSTFVGNATDFLMVNKEGKRFVNESLSRYAISGAIMKQSDNVGYVISDVNNCLIKGGLNSMGMSEAALLKRGQLIKADTLEDLAKQIGADPKVLENTISTFNGYAVQFDDPDFGRTIFTKTAPITTAPFYASARTWAAHITLGGIVVNDETYQALDAAGNPVNGLYCVGELVAERSGVHSMSTGLVAAEAILKNS